MPEANFTEAPQLENIDRGTSPLFNRIRDLHLHQEREWGHNPELIERQKTILKALPDREELVRQIKDSLKREEERRLEHEKRTGRSRPPIPLWSQIRGELHERLVAAESILFFSSQRPEVSVYGADRWADPTLEAAITETLKNPPFASLENMRKPDLSYIEARTGNLVVITGIGEAKAAKTLDHRAFEQLNSHGVRTTLETLAREVNQLSREEAEERGLKGLGRGGLKLVILQRFVQYVYMCRDVDISNPDTLIDRAGHRPGDSFNEDEYYEFCSMLDGTHPTSKIVLRNSSFSEAELNSLVSDLMTSIDEK